MVAVRGPVSFAADPDVKQTVAYRLRTTWYQFILCRDTSLGVRVGQMLKSGVYHLRPVCRIYEHVSSKFSASKVLVAQFFF
jgi:hypothetical protein